MSIFDSFNQFFKRLFGLGVSPDMPVALAERIRFVNRVAFILGAFCPFWILIGPPNFTYQMVFVAAMAGYASVIGLNYLGNNILGRLSLSFVIVFACSFLGTMGSPPNLTGAEQAVQLSMIREMLLVVQMFLLSLMLIPVFAFRRSETVYMGLCFIIFIVGIFAMPGLNDLINILPYEKIDEKILTQNRESLIGSSILWIIMVAYLGLRIDKKVNEARLEVEQIEKNRLVVSDQEAKVRAAEAHAAREELLKIKSALEMSEYILKEKANEAEQSNLELVRMLADLNANQKAIEEQQYLESGMARIAELMRLDEGQSMENWTERLLAEIVQYTGALNAVLYVASVNQTSSASELKYWGGYAGLAQGETPETIAFGKGWLGSVAKTRQPVFHNNLKPGAVKLAVGLGELPVSGVLMQPLLYNNLLEGVLEINSVQSFEPRHKLLIERISGMMAANIQSLKNQDQINRLLEEAQTKASLLAAQETEMKQYVADLTETEKKNRKMQTELAQSEASLYAVLNSANDRIYAIDQNYNLLLFNEITKKTIEDGYEIKLEKGMSIFDFVYEDSRAKRKASFDRALKGERFTEEQHIEGDGYDAFFETIYNPIFDLNKQIIGVSVFSHDITERKESDEILRKSEQRLKIQFEQIPLGIIEWTPDFNCQAWNPAAEKIFGYTKEAAVGKHALDLVIAPHLREESKSELEKLIKKTGAVRRVFENGTQDGRIIICEWFNTPILDEEGKLITLMSIVQDITERNAAEEALRHSETNLKMVQKLARLGSWEYDVASETFDWSEVTFENFGLKMGVDPTPSILEFWAMITPQDKDEFKALFEQAIVDNLAFNYTARVVKPDGKTNYLEIRGSAQTNASGEVVKLTGACADMTAIKRAEQELIRQNKQMEAGERLLRKHLEELNEAQEDNERIQRELKKSQEKLLGMNQNLEQMVEERNAELQSALTSAKKGELQLAAMLNQFPISIQIFAPNGSFIQGNTATEQLWGISLEKYKAENYNVLNDPQFSTMGLTKKIAAAFNGEFVELPEAEYFIQHGDSLSTLEFKWLRIVIFPVKDDDGQIFSVVTYHQDITKLKQAEVSLKNSTAFQEAILNSANFGLFYTDLDKTLISVNKQLERLLGYSAGELINQSTPHLFHLHEELEIRQKEFAELFRQGSENSIKGVFSNESEWSYVRKDGTEFPISLSITGVRNANWELIGYVGVFMDITRQKRAEKALRNSERRFRGIIEQFPLGLQLFSPQGQSNMANAALGKLMRFEASESGLYNIFEDEFLQKNNYQKYLDRVLNGESVSIPALPYENGGAKRWIRTFAFPIADEQNSVHEFGIVYEDITMTVMANEQLRSSEKRFRLLIEQFPASIQIFTQDGKIAQVNEAFEKLWGKRGTYTLSGADFLELKPYADKVESAMKGSFVELPPIRYEKEDANGQKLPFWLVSSLFPVKNDAGEMRELVFVQNNITQQQLAEQQVRETNNELKASLAELEALQTQLLHTERMATLGQMFAGIAHEINNPVGAVATSTDTAIQVYPEVLKNYPTLFSQAGEYTNVLFDLLSFVLTNKLSLSSKEERKLRRSLAEQLEPFSPEEAESCAYQLVEAGFKTDDIEPYRALFEHTPLGLLSQSIYDIAQVKINLANVEVATDKIRKIMRALKKYSHGQTDEGAVPTDVSENIDTILTLYSNQLKLNIELETNFQPTALVAAYPDELGQVWTNLISNALHAMNNIGSLKVEVYQEGDEVLAKLTDSGSGIPPEKIDKIFDPFFTTKKRGEGTGLGLHLCKKIIDKHNGRMWVDSEPGRTTFTIALPILNENVEQTA